MRPKKCCGWPRPYGNVPEAQREAIVLHHLQRQTLSQIAQQLSKSDAAV